MTVADLIEILKTMPPKAKVLVETRDGYENPCTKTAHYAEPTNGNWGIVIGYTDAQALAQDAVDWD